jgi:hypothetical protein
MLDFHHKKITGVIPAERIIDAKESGGFYIRNPPRLFFSLKLPPNLGLKSGRQSEMVQLKMKFPSSLYSGAASVTHTARDNGDGELSFG